MSNVIVRKYDAILKSRGGLRAILQRYGIVRVCDAGFREAWLACGTQVLRWFGRHPGKGYGRLEAILFPLWDYWVRYSRVVDVVTQLEPGNQLRLLEVSSGRGGISWLFRDPAVRSCLVDRDPQLLKDPRGGKSWRVCADAASLPFPSDSFDVVISVDTVEHLPAEIRSAFISELKRVAAHTVVITCPMQSEDGKFRAAESDRRLRQDIEDRGNPVPDWLEEHIRNKHPMREELAALLPEAKITGTQNCDAWLRYSCLYHRPLGWLVAGLRYRSTLARRDAVPPHWRGTLVWRKRNLSNPGALRETLESLVTESVS